MNSPRAEAPSFRDRAASPWLYYYLLNGFATPGGSRADETQSRRQERRASAEVVRAYRSRRLKQAVLGALFEEYDRADRRPMSPDTHYV